VEDPTASPGASVAAPDAVDADGGSRGFADAARDAWQDERVEIVAAILLSLATVLSAWGAYQATRWSGVQADSYAEAAALRSSASGHTTIASRQIQIDVATYIAWSDATISKDLDLAQYLELRFRSEFTPAFVAWLQSGPPDATTIPEGTPFDRPEYVLAEQVAADADGAAAEQALKEARDANQLSDNFVLTAVLFASVLFFAGIAARFRPQWIRWAMLAVATLVFAIGLVVEFSLPQNVGF
jgi:cation transport ATPase